MARQRVSDSTQDRVLFSTSPPRLARRRSRPPLFGHRRTHLRDVSRDRIRTLAELLSMPVGENIPEPSGHWRGRQAAGVRGLSASVRMPKNLLMRALVRGGQRGLPLCPAGVRRLCDGHRGLDPRVVQDMKNMVIAETNTKFASLRRWQHEMGPIDEQVRRWLERTALIGGIWISAELFRSCYGFRFGDSREAGRLSIGSLAGGARNRCAACNLAVVGGRDRALIDLRAGCLARRHFHGGKVPRVMRLLDAWTACFGERERRRMHAESNRLADAITQTLRELDVFEELRYANAPRPGSGVFAAAEGDDDEEEDVEEEEEEEEEEPVRDEVRGKSSLEPSYIDSGQTTNFPRRPAASYSQMSPYAPTNNSANRQRGQKGHATGSSAVPSDWLEQQARDMGVYDNPYMDPFRSGSGQLTNFTHPSAVPTPLIGSPRSPSPPGITVTKAPPRSVSPESDIYDATPPASPGRTASKSQANGKLAAPQDDDDDDDDDDDSWVSASVYTYADPSRPTSWHRPPGTGYGGLPMPNTYETPRTPPGNSYSSRSNRDKPLPKRPRPEGVYGGLILPQTPPSFGGGGAYLHLESLNPYARDGRRLSHDTELSEMLERERVARERFYKMAEAPPSSFYSQDGEE